MKNPSLSVGERHTQEREEFASLYVGFSRRHDDDVHAANLIDFVVFDFWENKLLLDADGVVAATVEGIAADTPEVANTRQGDVHELVEEIIHASAAQCDFATDSHAGAKFPCRQGFASASDDGLLTGDSRQVVNSRIENFGIADSVAASHIDDDLFELGHLHDVGVGKFLRHGADNLSLVLVEKSAQDNTSVLADSL